MAILDARDYCGNGRTWRDEAALKHRPLSVDVAAGHDRDDTMQVEEHCCAIMPPKALAKRLRCRLKPWESAGFGQST